MEGSPRDRLVIGLGLAALAATHVARAWRTLDSVVDDAYISSRYAEQFALGNGLVYNAGEPPIEGYTNLLWVLQSALIWRLTPASMHGIAVYGGLVYGVLGIAAVTTLGIALARKWTPFALLPGLWLALDPHYAVVATNGIESSQFIFAVSASLAAVLWSEHDGAARWVATALVAAIVAVRPEGVAVAVALAGYDLIRRRDALGKPSTWQIAGGAVAGIVPVWLGRRWYFGEWLPNTWYAKDHRSAFAQIKFDLAYLGQDDWPFWVAVGLAFVVAAAAPKHTLPRAIVTAIVLGLVIVAFRVDMWMPGGRLLLPAVAPALVLFADRARALCDGPLAERGAFAVALGVALAVLPAAPLLAGPIPAHVFAYDGRHTALPDNGAQRAAAHLAAHAPPGAVLATRDAGVLAYYVGPNVNVAELHDRALTRPHPGGTDAAILTYTPVNPEFFIATLQREDAKASKYANDNKISRRFTAEYRFLGRVKQHYHRYYDVYVRADLDVPPLPAEIVVKRSRVKR